MSPSSQAVPIYEGHDFYVPTFEVRLDGRPPGREVIRDVLSVTYKDSVKDLDSFELTINNWDAEELRFKYSDDKLFDPGTRVELHMGYMNELRPMLRGEITSLRPSFPAGAGSTLAVSGLNVLHRFRTKEESRTYTNKSDREIAEEIGNRLNVEIKTKASSDEPRFNYVIQDNQFDIVFLMERARRAGFDLRVEETDDGTVINYTPSTTTHEATYRLTYGKSLIEFQPELTTAQQVAKVTVKGWDVLRKEPISFTATRDQLKVKGVGERGGQDAIEKSIEAKEEVIATKPVESQEEARKLAIEILEGIAKDMVKASGSVVGLPDLRAGTVLEIDGLGKRFSGRYFVMSTTHSIGDGGYTTQFECRREEI
jgi:phage protein D